MTTEKSTSTSTPSPKTTPAKTQAKTSASKLASSVRRAKTTQAAKTAEDKVPQQSGAESSVSKEETIQRMPSSRVWPD